MKENKTSPQYELFERETLEVYNNVLEGKTRFYPNEFFDSETGKLRTKIILRHFYSEIVHLNDIKEIAKFRTTVFTKYKLMPIYHRVFNNNKISMLKYAFPEHTAFLDKEGDAIMKSTSSLTIEDRKEILTSFENGEQMQTLAKRFNVSLITIRDITKKKSWSTSKVSIYTEKDIKQFNELKEDLSHSDMVDKYIENIVKKIKSICKEKNITQVKLHEITGISMNQISRIIHDKSKPSIATIIKLTHGIGYKLDITERKEKV